VRVRRLACCRSISFDHYDRADRVLIGTSAAFDFHATHLPVNLRYVGPPLDTPEWAYAWVPPWSDNSTRSRVFVSVSTSFQNQAVLLQHVIAAIGTIELDAIVTVGPATMKETFTAPPNVLILPGAPHDLVMKEVSLVVTLGGYGTVARSLVNGIPLLVIPMGRDQGATPSAWWHVVPALHCLTVQPRHRLPLRSHGSLASRITRWRQSGSAKRW
jgi:UDP:flavonoid glycosyltransferase YjiC (YdhE family)